MKGAQSKSNKRRTALNQITQVNKARTEQIPLAANRQAAIDKLTQMKTAWIGNLYRYIAPNHPNSDRLFYLKPQEMYKCMEQMFDEIKTDSDRVDYQIVTYVYYVLYYNDLTYGKIFIQGLINGDALKESLVEEQGNLIIQEYLALYKRKILNRVHGKNYLRVYRVKSPASLLALKNEGNEHKAYSRKGDFREWLNTKYQILVAIKFDDHNKCYVSPNEHCRCRTNPQNAIDINTNEPSAPSTPSVKLEGSYHDPQEYIDPTTFEEASASFSPIVKRESSTKCKKVVQFSNQVEKISAVSINESTYQYPIKQETNTMGQPPKIEAEIYAQVIVVNQVTSSLAIKDCIMVNKEERQVSSPLLLNDLNIIETSSQQYSPLYQKLEDFNHIILNQEMTDTDFNSHFRRDTSLLEMDIMDELTSKGVRLYDSVTGAIVSPPQYQQNEAFQRLASVETKETKSDEVLNQEPVDSSDLFVPAPVPVPMFADVLQVQLRQWCILFNLHEQVEGFQGTDLLDQFIHRYDINHKDNKNLSTQPVTQHHRLKLITPLLFRFEGDKDEDKPDTLLNKMILRYKDSTRPTQEYFERKLLHVMFNEGLGALNKLAIYNFVIWHSAFRSFNYKDGTRVSYRHTIKTLTDADMTRSPLEIHQSSYIYGLNCAPFVALNHKIVQTILLMY